MKQVMCIFTLLVIACTACGTSSNNVGAIPDINLGAIVDEANDNRQEPSGNTQGAVVNGKLAFSGFTVLNTAGQPLVGTNIYTGITARLVDPEDDILSTVILDTQGHFTLSYAGDLTNLRLEIRLTVRDDLDGDGIGNELLRQMVPVYLAPGYTATVNWTIRKGLSVDFDQRLLPAKGLTLVSWLDVLDNSGQKSQYYATIFATSLAVMDLDGDRFFELGEDLSGADINHDGWIDESQLAPGTPDEPVLSQVVGVVVSVDIAQQQFRLRLKDGTELTVTKPPFTTIEIYDQRSGTFLGPVPLDTQLIQSTVVVEGSEAGNGIDATWVVIYR